MEQPIDILAKTFLIACHKGFLIPFIIVGYCTVKRPLFSRALLLLLFTLSFNVYLKSIWQIPLPPHLGPGFTFPSGHMQSAVVFWGWLAWEFRRPWFFGVVLVLLAGIGFSLVHFNYHNGRDIMGALLFGSISLIIYYYICDAFKGQNNALIGFVLLILTLPILLLIPDIRQTVIFRFLD